MTMNPSRRVSGIDRADATVQGHDKQKEKEPEKENEK
jgi:hypothetical protein